MANTYNTGNPVGSTDPRDLKDNASNLDDLLNGPNAFYPSRLGVQKQSWTDMQNAFALAQAGRTTEFQEFLVASGFVSLGNYAAGLNFTAYNQYMARDGFFYRPAPSTIPFTTTGTWVGGDEDLFVLLSADDVLRQDLANDTDPAKGAGLLGYLGGTLPDYLAIEQAALDAVEAELASLVTETGSISDIAKEGTSYRLSLSKYNPQRLRSAVIPSIVYDHFGLIDLLPTGELIAMYRRGTSHESDAGNLVYSKTTGGAWGAVTVIADDPVYDLRGAAGGVMPTGRVVAATAKRTPDVADWRDIVIYVSDDYGDTWTLKQSIPHATPLAGRNTYGKGRQLGDKYVIPYYGTNGSGVYYVRLLETTDGGETWTEGAYITNIFASLYNETDILPLGGGYVYAVTRIGDGSGGVFKHFLSVDNGVTWADRGEVPATLGAETNTVVTPSLEYVTGTSGRPHVLLTYTDRTSDQCVYRTCPVDSIIADIDTAWSATRGVLYSAPNLSGYQNTVRVEGRIIGNLFRETTVDSVSGAYQFEIDINDLPDYDSGFTAATIATTYLFTHGLQRRPTRVLVEFSSDEAGNSVYVNSPSQIYDAATNKGIGALVSQTSTQIGVRTGTFALVYGAVFGSPTIANITSGYMRVRAWL